MTTAAKDAQNGPMVRFDSVTKSYGALTVLDKLDLEISAGEKVAAIGPSGSGKTTVLRMLMTLETINSGVIWVDGSRSRTLKAGVGWCRRMRSICVVSAARSVWSSSTSISSRI